MNEYKDSEIVTMTLERYENLKSDLDYYETELRNFLEECRIDDTIIVSRSKLQEKLEEIYGCRNLIEQMYGRPKIKVIIQ